jgi:hypothetical protein
MMLHRRFPWLQVVFCLACLMMTGYTWMRYSCAREVHVGELMALGETHVFRLDGRRSVDGKPRTDHSVNLQPRHVRPWLERLIVLRGTLEYSHIHAAIATESDRQLMAWVLRDGEKSLLLNACVYEDSSPPELLATGCYGRLSVAYFPSEPPDEQLYFDTTTSRFHPASVAGIVVGLMGCFIFGLYFRRWLRERKALASEPQQDMIA